MDIYIRRTEIIYTDVARFGEIWQSKADLQYWQKVLEFSPLFRRILLFPLLSPLYGVRFQSEVEKKMVFDTVERGRGEKGKKNGLKYAKFHLLFARIVEG